MTTLLISICVAILGGLLALGLAYVVVMKAALTNEFNKIESKEEKEE